MRAQLLFVGCNITLILRRTFVHVGAACFRAAGGGPAAPQAGLVPFAGFHSGGSAATTSGRSDASLPPQPPHRLMNDGGKVRPAAVSSPSSCHMCVVAPSSMYLRHVAMPTPPPQQAQSIMRN